MAISIVLGLLFGLAALMIGLGLAGGGHGWNGPFFFSMLLVFLYPIAFARALDPRRGTVEKDVVLLICGAVLDIFVIMSFSSEVQYIAKMWRMDEGPLFISLWLFLWAGWQILILVALIGRKIAERRSRRT